MARKTLNRKELRAENDAAEKAGIAPKKKVAAKKPAVRKSRAKKAAASVRMKALWGVFNQGMKRVAAFEYSERKQADKKAEEMSASQKSPHFVQLVREAIEE